MITPKMMMGYLRISRRIMMIIPKMMMGFLRISWRKFEINNRSLSDDLVLTSSLLTAYDVTS